MNGFENPLLEQSTSKEIEIIPKNQELNAARDNEVKEIVVDEIIPAGQKTKAEQDIETGKTREKEAEIRLEEEKIIENMSLEDLALRVEMHRVHVDDMTRIYFDAVLAFEKIAPSEVFKKFDELQRKRIREANIPLEIDSTKARKMRDALREVSTK